MHLATPDEDLDRSILGYMSSAEPSSNFVVVRNGCIARDYYHSEDAIHSQATMEAIRQRDGSLDRYAVWTHVYADPRLNGFTFTVRDVTDGNYLRPGRGDQVERSAQITQRMLLGSGQRAFLMSQSNGKRDDRLHSRLVARIEPLMEFEAARHRVKTADYADEVRAWSSILQIEYEERGRKPTVVMAWQEHASRADAMAHIEALKPAYPGLVVEEHILEFGSRPAPAVSEDPVQEAVLQP